MKLMALPEFTYIFYDNIILWWNKKNFTGSKCIPVHSTNDACVQGAWEILTGIH